MTRWKNYLIILFMVISAPIALAASPAGSWTTIDDVSGKKRAVVQLTINGDTLTGDIISIYPQPGDSGICDKCPGAFKNKPIKGLQILWGLKDQGNGVWDGGKILDPKTGKIYNAKITLDGNNLYVRGYIGFSVLGRTQTWHR